jgi:hypothetical protein
MVFDFNRFSVVLALFLCTIALFFMGCDETRVGDTLSQIEQPVAAPNSFSADE